MNHLAGMYVHTPLNSTEIPQAALNLELKQRSNPFAWNGQFSPQLVEIFLKTYATSPSTILDPFLGSGTTLLEAGRLGLTAYGTEINPAAVTLARNYEFINFTPEVRQFNLRKVDAILSCILPEPAIFRAYEQNLAPAEIINRLIEAATQAENHVQSQILETIIALLDVKSTFSSDDLLKVWRDLKAFLLALPFSEHPLKIFHTDARCIPLPNHSIDLVITSPPYINVFNYHQQYRPSMERLHWDLLTIAKSEFGANRKHRGNRFLTIIQYCLDLAQVFDELSRLCHASTKLIFVVGRESKIRGTQIFNGEIVAEIACRALNFSLLLRQERTFMNRFGEKIVEDILHFSPPTTAAKGDYLDIARMIAQEVLGLALTTASEAVKNDIQSALENSAVVSPSPIFELLSALKATPNSMLPRI